MLKTLPKTKIYWKGLLGWAAMSAKSAVQQSLMSMAGAQRSV